MLSILWPLTADSILLSYTTRLTISVFFFLYQTAVLLISIPPNPLIATDRRCRVYYESHPTSKLEWHNGKRNTQNVMDLDLLGWAHTNTPTFSSSPQGRRAFYGNGRTTGVQGISGSGSPMVFPCFHWHISTHACISTVSSALLHN